MIECGICLENVHDGTPVFTAHPHEAGENLQHLFHQLCINPWLENHINCPTCRRPVHVIHPQPQDDHQDPAQKILLVVSNLILGHFQGFSGSHIGYALITHTTINPTFAALGIGVSLIDLTIKAYFGNFDIVDELFKIIENHLLGFSIGLAFGCIQICAVTIYEFYYCQMATYMSKLAYAKEQMALACAQFDLPKFVSIQVDSEKFTAFFFSHEVSLEKLLSAFPKNIAWDKYPIIDFINTKPFSLFYHVKDAFAFSFSFDSWQAPIIAPFKIIDLNRVATLIGAECLVLKEGFDFLRNAH